MMKVLYIKSAVVFRFVILLMLFLFINVPTNTVMEMKRELN